MLDNFYNSFEIESEQEMLIKKKCAYNGSRTIVGYWDIDWKINLFCQ